MPKTRLLALAVSFLAAGSLAYAALTRVMPAPEDALPAGSFLAGTLDVAAFRASPLYPPMFENDHAFGIGDLALACGFDPIARIEQLDLAIPEDGERGDFGVAFNADVTEEELVHCADAIAGKRGEKRATSTVGHFRVIDDGKGHTLAARESGNLILVGKSTWVRAMIDAADRRGAALRSNRAHMALREALTARGEKPLLLVTALLPAPLRDRLKREMGAEVDGRGERAPNEALAGVLGVNGAGLSLRLTSEGVLEARAELACDSEGACAEVKKLLLAQRLTWSQDFTLRAVGLGPAIDAFEVDAHGSALTATTHATATDLATAIERIQRALGRGGRPKEPPRTPAPGPPPRPPPAPDELVPARDAAKDAGGTRH